MEQLPNELWMEILSHTEGDAFDLVEDSVEMDRALIKSTLARVSQGMKTVSQLLPEPPKKKFSKSQWATLFAHRGYVTLLKILAEKNCSFDAWLHQVAVNAGQTDAAAYLQPSVKGGYGRPEGLKEEVQLIVDQTALPKWKCFESLRGNGGDIVSAIMELTC